MMTQKELKSILHYDPSTGVFTWKIKPSNHVKIDDVAGNKNKHHGYTQIGFKYILYQAHRLAFLYMTDDWPADQVDHINHNRSDNRWMNLRNATKRINGMNKSICPSNTSGVTGVHWDKPRKKWKATIQSYGVKCYLGLFIEFNDAVTARKAAEIEHGFHVNHGV